MGLVPLAEKSRQSLETMQHSPCSEGTLHAVMRGLGLTRLTEIETMSVAFCVLKRLNIWELRINFSYLN